MSRVQLEAEAVRLNFPRSVIDCLDDDGLREQIKAAQIRRSGIAHDVERPQPENLPIIGRERALIDALAELLRGATAKKHQWTHATATRRGSTFEVGLFDGPEYTRRIARVTIELDRVDHSEQGEIV